METCILHFQFDRFFELADGYAEMGLKIGPILFDWFHPVPGLYCILKCSCLFDDGVCGLLGLDMDVRVSCKLYIFQEVFDLV